ncbi:MAG: AAA family ATPase, partial [Metallibacterium sp.]
MTQKIYQKFNSELERLKFGLEEKYPQHEFNWKQAGNRFIGLCPEHEDKSPSFNIFEINGHQHYKCFACDFQGHISSITGQKLSEIEVKKITDRRKRQIEVKDFLSKAKENLFISDNANEYLAKRFGVDKFDYIVKQYQVGYISDSLISSELPTPLELEMKKKYNGCLAFFYENLLGEITQIHLRQLNTKTFYTHKIETDKGFFGLNVLMKSQNHNFLFLVEGEFDMLSPIVISKNAIPVLSVGGSANYDTAMIKIFQELGFAVVLSPDWDRAGEEVLERIIKQEKGLDKIFRMRISEKGIKDFDELFHKFPDILSLEGKYEFETLSEYKIRKDRNIRDEIIAKKIPSEIKKLMAIKFDGVQEYQAINARDIISGDIKPDEFVIKGFLKKTVGIFAGDSGAGKSYLALQLAMCIADTSKTLNIENLIVSRGKVGYLTLEDTKSIVLNRLKSIYLHFKIQEGVPQGIFESALDNLDISVIRTPYRLIRKERFEYKHNQKSIDFLRSFAKGKELVIIDTLIRCHALSENDSGDMTELLVLFEGICEETGASILLIHHTKKDEMSKNSISKIR